MSSHQLGEVEQLCTRVGIVDRGRLVLQQDLDELRAPTGRVVVRTPDADQAAALLAGHVDKRDDDRLVVAEADPAAVNARLVAAGLRVAEIGPERRSLEELMLAVTGSGSDRIDRPRRQGAPGEGAAGEGAAGEGAAGEGAAGEEGRQPGQPRRPAEGWPERMPRGGVWGGRPPEASSGEAEAAP
jgi:ABC-2 type transport system ATP-binding protein